MNNNFVDGLSVLSANMARIHSNIRYADAKSGVVLLINIGLLKATYELLDGNFSIENMTSHLFYIPSVILLVIGGLFCILVVKPRGNEYSKSRGPGLFDPVRVSQYSEVGDYVRAIKSAKDDEIYQNMYELMWDLSKIDRSKYHTLRHALFISILSWIAFLLWVTEMAYQNHC